jgi:hypothetical protein
MIRDGFYSASIIDEQWDVYRTKHPKKSMQENSVEENAYRIFSRIQLAWMGLSFGLVILILLNIEFDYRSLIEQISREMLTIETEVDVSIRVIRAS